MDILVEKHTAVVKRQNKTNILVASKRASHLYLCISKRVIIHQGHVGIMRREDLTGFSYPSEGFMQ